MRNEFLPPTFFPLTAGNNKLIPMDQVTTLLLGRKTPEVQILESVQESEITDLWLPLEKLTSRAVPRKVSSRTTAQARAAVGHLFWGGL